MKKFFQEIGAKVPSQYLLARNLIITIILFLELIILYLALHKLILNKSNSSSDANLFALIFWLTFFIGVLIFSHRFRPWFSRRPSLSFIRYTLPLLLLGDFLFDCSVQSVNRSTKLSIINADTLYNSFLLPIFISPVWEEIARLGFIVLSPFHVVHALIFAIAHYPSSFIELLMLTCLGFVFTLITLKTQSVWNSVILHSIVNMVGINVSITHNLTYVTLTALGGFITLCVLTYQINRYRINL